MESTSATTSSESERLAACFAASRAAGRRALIPYITAGYPSRGGTLELMMRLVDAGADIIELGVPFSDPLADGPTIQRASHQAIENGASLPWTLEVLAAFRRAHDAGIVLFTYLNPLLAYGVDRFLEDARSAGADGVLITDLPVDADAALEERLEASPLALIRLVAPTTAPERAARIARRAQGFLYYVARTGVTGASRALRQALADEVGALRRASGVPVAVGFGISTPEQAAAVARVADGVVVGSALIDALNGEGMAGAAAFLASLREAVDGAGAPPVG